MKKSLSGVAGIGLVMCFLGAVVGCGAESTEPTGIEPEEPNKDVPYRGVDGVLTSDPLAAECPDDPRNPGRVMLKEMKEMSFYEDRAGTKPLAEKCTYAYKGFEADPHYFPEALTSVWLVFELTGTAAGCEAFTHVVMRPPHGDGEVKHMHLRYGGKSTTAAALLDMSGGDYEDKDVCNPWWSVYCSEGAEACDG